ncbi:nuclear transport factor 2 family protein [Naasia sp. SYSU D00948]|uniref:nuclear transport factor 2 family protein n=1 Tax=Naasia sp. SYSU D00948 TaxID=2817379 RepID=UPI001B30FF1C|nr:nuclear transport factor 2 family protein [Naasia sp. SYSU D00948]
MTLTTSTLDSVIVVWHVAVNAGDAEAAASACTEDVEMGGPEGSARGRDIMRDWVATAGVRLMPKEAYDIPGGIVVAQEVTRPGQDRPERVYSAFGLRDGSISAVHQFPTLEQAKAFPVAV